MSKTREKYFVFNENIGSGFVFENAEEALSEYQEQTIDYDPEEITIVKGIKMRANPPTGGWTLTEIDG